MARKRTGTAVWRSGRWFARLTVETNEIGADGRPVRKRAYIDLERPDLKDTPGDAKRARREALLMAKQVAKDGAKLVGKAKATAGTLTIADCEKRFFEALAADPRLKESTRAGYRSSWRAHVMPQLGAHKLTDPNITAPIRAFFQDLRKAKEPSTVRNCANALAKFFAYAKAEKWAPLVANPMRDEDVREMLPMVEAPDPEEITFLPRASVETMLARPELVHERFGKHLVEVTSGVREGELHGLTFALIVIDAPTKPRTPDDAIPHMKIKQQLAKPREKGDTVEVTDVKYKWSKRNIPLHPAARPWLRWWHAEGWAAYVGRAPEPADFVFPDAGGFPVRPRGADDLREDLEAAGLPTTFVTPAGDEKPFVAHTLRHSFSTWLGELGVDGDTIDRLLGHAPKSTRMRHYQAPSLEAYARVVALLELELPDRPGVEIHSAQIAAQATDDGSSNDVKNDAHLAEKTGYVASRKRSRNWCAARSSKSGLGDHADAENPAENTPDRARDATQFGAKDRAKPSPRIPENSEAGPNAGPNRTALDEEAALVAAIDRLTRAMGVAADDAVAEIVAERRAMREELEALRRARSAGKVVPIGKGRSRR